YRDMGEFSNAMESFSAARATLEEVGDVSLQAMLDYDQALCHKMQGESDIARDMLLKANDTFKELGMILWVQRAEAALNLL
ncbi:MAG: hypothetical protein KAJ64_02395, partial [Thermoplasmata archaeon]|nr:hypothetical protein [Thermoplasmata archaeon]